MEALDQENIINAMLCIMFCGHRRWLTLMNSLTDLNLVQTYSNIKNNVDYYYNNYL